MTLMPKLQDLVDALSSRLREVERQARNTPRFRQATVTAVATNPNRVTINLAGDLTPIANVRYLASYTAAVNDTVWLIQNGPDFIVLGRLS